MDSIDNKAYIGRVLDDRYRIKSLVGSGGMSRVFLADDLVRGRELAIKMLREEIARDEESVERFVRESTAVSMLSHPNVVSVYDVSVNADEKYIVLEYAEGITLKEYLKEHGPLSAEEAIRISVQILSGLQHAHSRGIIHRDIKPQNIIIAPDGSIKLTDFGIAKIHNSDTISKPDKAIGSVHYISPEQASGAPVAAPSDLYSVGIILYEIITNRLPFDAENAVAVACMQISNPPVPPSNVVTDVPKGLEQIILKAMNKRPVDRFENASQMLTCLQRLEATPDAVFDFIIVSEDNESTVITKSDSAVDNKTTPKDAKGESAAVEHGSQSKKKKKPKKIVEVEVVRKKSPISMFPIIFGILCAFCAVLLVVLIYVLQTYFFTENGNSRILIVDDFISQTYSEAMKNELETNGYSVTVEWVSSSDHLANTIISQNPEKDTRRTLHRGSPTCELTLVVSSGENLITLADYTGMEYRQAKLDLEKNKISYKIEKVYSTALEEGTVISTYPKAGTIMGSDTQITLYVSKGGNVKYVTMPDLTGLTAAELDATLKEANIRLGKVSYTYSNYVSAGLVISQSLVSGVTVQAGITAVDIVVSLGPKIEIPVVPDPPVVDPDESPETAPEVTPPETAPEVSGPENSTPEGSQPDNTPDEPAVE
jgi:serine/threonine-protein kinase